MKKILFRFTMYMATLVAIAWGNNAALLHFHPLEYYYTLPGILLTAAVAIVEAMVLTPIGTYVFNHWVMQPLKESVAKGETVAEFKED